MDITSVKQPDRKILEQVFFSIENNLDKDSTNFLTPSLFPYFKSKIFRKFILNPQCIIYVARENEMVVGFAFLIFLEWDSNIFGFSIGKIDNLFIKMADPLKYNFLQNIIQDCIKERYVHLVCRIGIKDFAMLNLLEKMQFNIADIQLTLSASGDLLDVPLPSSNKFEIRSAKTDDLEQLREIVKDGFTDTRFVVDSRYPREKVNQLYFEWVKNSVLDPAQSVFVVKDNSTERLIGFSICNFDPDSEITLGIKIGCIDLIAVAKNYRNQGIGQMLVKFVLSWFKAKVDKVEIRTQVSNIPAIRAFMNGGFKEFSSGIMLPAGISMHRWF